MAAHITAAQARALGIDVSARTPSRTGRTAKGPQLATCHTCGAELVGETAAARHNAETHHGRYPIPLTPP